MLEAARRGEWRVVSQMLDRVFGRPTEHIVSEPSEPRWKRDMASLSLEELQALAFGRHLRAVDDEDPEAASG